MEELKKILKSYKLYLEPKYDLHGIILKPVILDEEIFWEFKNPNDFSVSKSILENFIIDLFYDFSKYVGGNQIFDKYQKKFCDFEHYDVFPRSCIYLNQSDTEYIWNELDKIKQIKFKGISINIDVVDFDFDNSFDEDFYMGFKVIIKDAYFHNSKKVYDNEIHDVISEVFYDDDFRDYEYDLFRGVNTIIIERPLLFDNGYTYFSHSMIPYYKNAKIIL